MGCDALLNNRGPDGTLVWLAIIKAIQLLQATRPGTARMRSSQPTIISLMTVTAPNRGMNSDPIAAHMWPPAAQ